MLWNSSEMRQADIDAEKPVILSEMAREASRATGRVSRAFNALAFPDHPYGRPSARLGGKRFRHAASDDPGLLSHLLRALAMPHWFWRDVSRRKPGWRWRRTCFGSWPARAVPEDEDPACAGSDRHSHSQPYRPGPARLFADRLARTVGPGHARRLGNGPA